MELGDTVKWEPLKTVKKLNTRASNSMVCVSKTNAGMPLYLGSMTILFLEQLLDGVIRAGKFYVYFTLAGRAWLIAKDCSIRNA